MKMLALTFGVLAFGLLVTLVYLLGAVSGQSERLALLEEQRELLLGNLQTERKYREASDELGATRAGLCLAYRDALQGLVVRLGLGRPNEQLSALNVLLTAYDRTRGTLAMGGEP